MTLEQIRQTALEVGLSEHRIQQLIDIVRPCTLLNPTSSDETLPVGHSRMGGLPDLAPGQEWPMWNGKPQSFIAQIDLAEINAFPGAEVLPPAGLLSFFYDSEQSTWGLDAKDAGSFRVLYSDSPNFQRTKPPVTMRKSGLFQDCRLEFETRMTLPSWESTAFQRLQFNNQETEQYDELLAQLFDNEVLCTDFSYLLGHPFQIQGEMERDCVEKTTRLSVVNASEYRKKIIEEAAQWRLLLQVASEKAAGMMWGDVGCLYYWIREDDLRNRQFNKVWMILQCS